MLFRRGGHLSSGECWFLDGTRLKVVNQYKYLGFLFSTKMSMNVTVDDLSVRGKRKSVHVLKALWNLQSTKPTVFTRLFDTQVQSTLLYGAEIWGLQRHCKIERAHTFACKRFLGLDSRSPNHMVYGDLGWFPRCINSSTRVIKYWLKLSKMGEDRLPKQTFELLKNCAISGDRNWAVSIKNCLFKMGFGFVWLNGGVGDEKRFLKHFKQRMKDCFIQEWSADQVGSERYAWYSSFKQHTNLEMYLNAVDIKKFRDALMRFRCGITD